ncbi:unnamed protein product [Adineta ricciae]|uniref:Uncharacterized protein n=1 Tax=Adineta ricciae TaxID=249248 RepID=A0A814D317_ADIRI|nr:unnamed protein product [Adineta ricciae]
MFLSNTSNASARIMNAIRICILLVIVLIVVNCTLVYGRSVETSVHREKRLFSCAKQGKRCSGLFGKSCCSGMKCHSTSGKCVPRGSPTSWLGDRNGK